jgi:hypothetical protein
MLRFAGVLLVVAMACGTAGPAWGVGFYLGETKEQLKLKYDVVVRDQGDERVSIEFTLADEGRLEPLDDVRFLVLAQEPDNGGGYSADILFSIHMHKGEGGKRVGRVQILKSLAERAEIVLDTHTLDGKHDGLTRLHHGIPVKNYLKNPAAAPAAKPDPAPAAAAPPATERKE